MNEFEVGDKVRYHPIIGGKHDGNVYEVRALGTMPSGERVAWLKGKPGCVATRALSHYEPLEGGGLPRPETIELKIEDLPVHPPDCPCRNHRREAGHGAQ